MEQMPDRITINNRRYVAEDVLPLPSEQRAEPFESVHAMCKEYGVNPHRAYRAVSDGRLDARMPNGSTRGLRCRRSEFVRWMESEWRAPVQAARADKETCQQEAQGQS